MGAQQVTTAHLAPVIAVTAFGVLLPKAAAGLLTIRRPEGAWADILQILPAGIVGALAAVAALGPHDGTFRPEVAGVGLFVAASTLAVRWIRVATQPKA